MDCSAIRDKLKEILSEDPELCPLLIRLTWHSCGTFDRFLENGGSNGGTIRFDREQADPENKGLERGFEVYEEVKREFDFISYADLYVLGGTTAIEWAGGPRINFKSGRKDFTENDAREVFGEAKCPFGDGKFNPNGSRLPAADLGKSHHKLGLIEKNTIEHVRNTFDRLGFTPQETVCLILLGHQFGQCHEDVSGYDGFWYPNFPFDWKGGIYARVYNKEFEEVYNLKTGKRQFEHNIEAERDKRMMMLVADMVLLWDNEYRRYLEHYKQKGALNKDAPRVWTKLVELGCENIDLVPEMLPQ